MQALYSLERSEKGHNGFIDRNEGPVPLDWGCGRVFDRLSMACKRAVFVFGKEKRGVLLSRVLITGANSGIGRATAVYLARQGHRVWAGIRNMDKAAGLADEARKENLPIKVVALDVTEDLSVREAVQQVVNEGGGIDVLVNNAGIGGSGVVEDIDLKASQAIFETNFWGVIRCTQAVLPGMREQQGGHVINISSFLGKLAGFGQVAYSASKWSLECLSESLAQEVAPFGIRVSIVQAGSTHTQIISNAVKRSVEAPQASAVYEDFYRRTTRLYEHGWRDAAPPLEVAKTILQVMEDPAARLRYPCAWGADDLITARSRMSEEDWVSLGKAETDEAYYARFQELFGLDISSPVTFVSNRGWRGRLRRLKRRFLRWSTASR